MSLLLTNQDASDVCLFNCSIHIFHSIISYLPLLIQRRARRASPTVAFSIQLLLLFAALAATIADRPFDRRQLSNKRTLALIALRVNDHAGQGKSLRTARNRTSKTGGTEATVRPSAATTSAWTMPISWMPKVISAPTGAGTTAPINTEPKKDMPPSKCRTSGRTAP